MELFDVNSSFNNLFERSSMKDYLVYSLMCLCISFMTLKILNFSSSGLAVTNSQPNYFSNALYFFISWSIFLSL